MLKVGLVSVAIDIEEDVKNRFKYYYEKASKNSSYDCELKIITDDKYKIFFEGEVFLNKSKAINDGVKFFIENNFDIIIQVDIDCVIPKGLIDLSVEWALKGYNFHAIVRNVDKEDLSLLETNKDYFYNLPFRESSKGCWNAMTQTMWKESGGFNEEIKGWGYEDEEFHDRLMKKNIKIKRLSTLLLLHVNHEIRYQGRRGDFNKGIALSKDWSEHCWLTRSFPNKIKPDNPVKLCILDKAIGLGDGVMSIPTVLQLSKTNETRVIASPPSYQILIAYADGLRLKVYDMNEQGYFYKNDHFAKDSLNLIYWDVFNSLRNFGCHAINAMRYCANLDPIDHEILPHIPIMTEIEDKVMNFVKCLPKPIIITQPFMSYWNKMIDINKYHKIVKALSKIGTVIQVGRKLPDNMVAKDGINLIGETEIFESLALLKAADVAFLPDSFLHHAAALTKTPTVTYFCGTSPEAFGYPFHINLFHPEIASCQWKAGRPMRWLFDYTYKDRNRWDTRSEEGWICPHKLCEKAITVDEVVEAVKIRLKYGRNVNWEFYDYKHVDKWDNIWK